MANPLRGEVAVDETPYVFRYSTNALAEAETISGENLLALLSKMEDGTPPGFKTLRVLLWAGLRWDNPKLTLSEAGDILDEMTIAKAIAAISAALSASLGVEGEAPSGKNR